MKREIDKFIIHCSDSDVPSHDDISVIRKWHVEENGWSDIGYHFFVQRDGNIQIGRPINRAGAHTRGQNKNSVGVCMHGRNWFTESQMKSVRRIYQLISFFLPDMTIHGHCEFDPKKSHCPGIDYKSEIIDKL